MTGRALLKIFLAALAIRWSYDLALFVVSGDASLMGVDSNNYVDAGKTMAESLAAGSLHDWQWLGPNPFMMPLHAWLVGISAIFAGRYAVLCDVLAQGLFDAGTCVVVCIIAQAMDRRYAMPTAIAAAINPTQIVIAGMVYPDSMFVLFVALMLLGALRWLRLPSWAAASMITIGVVGAAWSRILIVPFAIALPFFLILATATSGRFHRRQVAQLASVLAVFVLALAPISARNKIEYGSSTLTPQAGMHLARWVVPLIWELRDGTPWARGYAEMERRAAQVPHAPDENSFQQSERYTKVALEELRRIGIGTIAKAWLNGAILNLGTPAIILSPPIAQLPRTGFYATQGKTAVEKVTNFLFHSDNALYGVILLAGVAGVLIVRALQLAGLSELCAQGHWLPLALFVLWCLFILVVNGPVASPKYRLPIEPVLVVLTGAGWCLLLRAKRSGPIDL